MGRGFATAPNSGPRFAPLAVPVAGVPNGYAGASFRHRKVRTVQQFNAASDFPSMSYEGSDHVFSLRQSGLHYRVSVTCRTCQRSFLATHSRVFSRLGAMQEARKHLSQHELSCAGRENTSGVYGRVAASRNRELMPVIDDIMRARPMPEPRTVRVPVPITQFLFGETSQAEARTSVHR